MGYSHPLAFKHVNDEHIDKVESVMKTQFLPGERLLIIEIAAHVRQIVDGNGKNKGLHHFQTKNTNNHETPVATDLQQNVFDGRTHFLLGKLVDAANRNSARKKGGYRYDWEIKRYAAYLRMLCGSLAYETIQKNLECALPSLTSTNRYIKSANCNVIEGILRSQELLIYLKERNLPLVVSLSEDATRIIGRVQYGTTSNQLIGFTLPLNNSNGLPRPYSFPARSAQEIYDHFSGNNSISNFLNVIMAQPVANASKPFCLLAFGSDNSYTSSDVCNRWKYIIDDLKMVGIKVLTISSDSDPRYNSAMRYLSRLGCRRDVHVNWFSCDGDSDGPFFIQVKIRNKYKFELDNV